MSIILCFLKKLLKNIFRFIYHLLIIPLNKMIVKNISNLMIKPGKSPVFDNPIKYELPFEDITFETSDNVTLSGWLIRGSSHKVIIQNHFGVQCSRCGYTQKGKGIFKNALWIDDILFLKQAKYLYTAGYSILMYDMRNHGNSQQIGWVSWGREERKDVIAAIKYISDHKDFRNASIGLLSICMGQAATVYAYGLENDMKSFEKLQAMISVQPLTYDYFLKALSLPNFLVRSVNKYNRRQRNMTLTGNAFLPYVKDVTVPTLVIQNRNDPMTNLDLVKGYYNDLQCEKEMLWLSLENKRGAAYAWLGNNSKSILSWFDKHLS